MSWLKNIFSSKQNKKTNFPNVVVGQIVAIENHPNADRLQLATVNVGKNIKVVCGAPNIAIGQLVPVALVGAVLANGLVIQQASIRGVESQGMICAADELGIGHDHTGIIVLDNGKIGEPIDNYINK
jgi:phenylalanyl-tRNA synthetase beta chain